MSRDITKRIDLNELEAKTLKMKADQCHLSEGEYLRELIMSSQPVEAPPRQFYVQMEKVNLSEIICEEILSESPEIDRKGIEPVFEQAEENIYVYADKKKLERVIQNLISNAVKYSVKRLEFVIEYEEAPAVTLRIITDATEDIATDKIFDRFYQQDSSRTKGGAGLGLYICKSFVEMMYGSISAKQEGDSFEIDLKPT